MKLKPAHLEKLRDPATRRMFEASDDGTQLRVIVTLKVEDDTETPPVPPSIFETRRETRQRLIETRARTRGAATSAIIEALHRRHLEVKGQREPRLTRSLVVDGMARDILNGIELPGVARVQIDRPLELLRARGNS